MINDKSNKQILKELDVYVSGHTQAKKQLINLISRSRLRHYQKYMQLIHDDHCIAPSKLLLIGQSGIGKTFLVNSLASIISFPLLYVDATKLNLTGASGGIKSETLLTMIQDYAKQLVHDNKISYPSIPGTIDRMVIFVDEIDKLAHALYSGSSWNDQVQANFLTLFEDNFEYPGISFIFAGAFSGLTKKDKKANGIGFHHNLQEDLPKGITDEDIIKYGLIPELVGRINAIVQLDNFTIDDYYKVLTEKLIPIKQREMELFHLYDLDLSELQLYEMCEKAEKSGQGVRSLKRELDRLFIEHEFEYEEIEVEEIKQLSYDEWKLTNE